MDRNQGDRQGQVGMPAFVVGAERLVDGELWRSVETTAHLAGCAECGTRTVDHGRTKTLARDLGSSDLSGHGGPWRAPGVL